MQAKARASGAAFSRGSAVSAVMSALSVYWLFGSTFETAGYRGLGAVLGVVLCGYLLTATPARFGARSGAAFAAMALACGAIAITLPKGVYIVYAVALIACLAAIFGKAAWRTTYAWPFTVLLAMCAVAVCAFWGGAAALTNALIGVSAVTTIAALNSATGQRLWRFRPTLLPVVLLCAGGLVALVMVTHTYYSKERFSSVDADWAGRMEHWRDVLRTVEDDNANWPFGLGLGRMPEAFFWKNAGADLPGSFLVVKEDGNQFLRLLGARFRAGYGDPLRILQAVRPTTPRIQVSLRTRSATSGQLQIYLCARHLIYNEHCEGTQVTVGPANNWVDQVVKIDASPFLYSGPPVPRPLFLVLLTETQKISIDIDDVRVTGADGEELQRNGTFTAGMNHWFFSSDRIHLAWHAKNMFLHTFVEQGVIGLALLAGMLLLAFGRLIAPIASGRHAAAAHGAALLGFVGVGMFDSLLDVPRLALAFYLVLFVGLVVPRRLLYATPSNGESGPETRLAAGGATDSNPASV